MMEVPYHYQFRIIVIGDTMVGKSSLLKAFSEGTLGEIEPTVGVDFFSKIIEIKPNQDSHDISTNKVDDNIVVKLQIWDTAGQERFKSIVTSYYRNSVGIILVYDVTNRESYDHLIDWFAEACRHVEPIPSPTLSPLTHNQSKINNAQNYPLTSTPNSDNKKYPNFFNKTGCSNSRDYADTPNSSFNSLNGQTTRLSQDNFKMAYLVLGCKTDLESQRQVSFEDGKAFADQYGFRFIETSSKLHHNVNLAFHILAEEIYYKISECSRSNRLYRTASGGHLTFDGTSSQVNEGIRIGPLIENNSKNYNDGNGIRLLEAQPVSGFMGGCC